ncbi:DUF1476 domain-containing protein [Woodsholea maritima]|uniref:DUF1476 domain-containing protein n=1 Tax=Woodsholea maritima TaxID=240237 RepID=UPI0003659438|nr:DUF1476 domain-containing protein [Woodsholea maritima]
MKAFKDRAMAFSNQFGHEQSLEFKAKMRRNKKIGRRAARLMGRTGADVLSYADEVLSANIAGGQGSLFAKLKADFHTHGVEMSDRQIQKFIDETMSEAYGELMVS